MGRLEDRLAAADVTPTAGDLTAIDTSLAGSDGRCRINLQAVGQGLLDELAAVASR